MMRVTTAVRLKQIMEERHLRQVDILKLCEPYSTKVDVKLSKSDLSQFVSGKVSPGQWKLSILGRALNVNEAWLMGYDVPRERATDEQLEIAKEVAQRVIENDENEKKLIGLYRSLNTAGQQALIATAESFAANPALQDQVPPAASVS